VPAKYKIKTRTVPNRFKAPARSSIIAWEEGCLRCPVCVKKQCVYGVYDKRSLDGRQMIDSIDNQCMSCLRCVQGCPKELIHKAIHPEFLALGDDSWTPEIIAGLWNQAETGKIPVSGAGYPGPYSGPGFDSMWTDMSEIVRPTRDGIHGREYISTSIDLGKPLEHLTFLESGKFMADSPLPLDIPVPVIFSPPPLGPWNKFTLRGWAMAAKELGTFMVLPHEMIEDEFIPFKDSLIPSISQIPHGSAHGLEAVKLVEATWDEGWKEKEKWLEDAYPSALISWRVPFDAGVQDNVLAMVDSGVAIIHLEGTPNGRFTDNTSLYIKKGVEAVHLCLVEHAVRDEVTILVGGGLAMAEHVAKSIICGADGVVIDLPLLVALECRLCRRCAKGLPCPVEIDRARPSWVASRVINLIGSWHNQLLEIMGAMGIRDVRRLRGEVGRAMFYDDLDRSIFGSLATLKEGYELE
jgi:ferredoxin